MTIYQNLEAIASQFDVFIFDAYGVFYNGAKFYPGARECMAKLVKEGKTVVILSNSSQLEQACRAGYAKKGLESGVDYHFFVTSGQVCYEDVQNKTLPVKGRKYFLIGQKHEAFSGTDYFQQVKEPLEADFVFISVPYLNQEQVMSMPSYKDCFLPAKADANGQVIYWDTLKITPFLPLIEKCVELGLPAINANPDFYASEKHLGTEDVAYVVRNGLVAEYYRRQGGKVYEYGKPHCKVYEYVFKLLQNQGINCCSQRTAMIGDTLRTDIKGAFNAGIVPVLCLETGVTSNEIKNGLRLEDLLAEEKLNKDKICFIRRVAN